MINRCIINEGETTCIISSNVWKRLGSPNLVSSSISLCAYDGRSSQPRGLYQNVPINLGGKMVMIDIDVINAQLDYNILVGCSYMHVMKVVVSTVLCIIMFPFNKKIITLHQPNYYDPHANANPENFLPMVGEVTQPPYVDIF